MEDMFPFIDGWYSTNFNETTVLNLSYPYPLSEKSYQTLPIYYGKYLNEKLLYNQTVVRLQATNFFNYIIDRLNAKVLIQQNITDGVSEFD